MSTSLGQIKEINSNKNVRFPKPKLIVADKTSFLDELKTCESSLFCIATKKETLEALQTIANENEAEVWRYSLTDVENSRKDFNWVKLCNDEKMAWLAANTILSSNRYGLTSQEAFRRSYEIIGSIPYYHVWRFPVFTVENGNQSPDFAKLRNNKVIAYLDLTDLENKETNPLSSLFFTIALEQLKQSDNTNTAYIFVDELTSIGQIPSLPINIGIVRAFNIGLVLATSDLDKLAMIYGLDDAKLIVGNGLDLSSVDEIERIYACD